MKTLPIIRHVRAIVLFIRWLRITWGYVWKSVFIWHLMTIEEIESSGLYQKERLEGLVLHLEIVQIWRGKK